MPFKISPIVWAGCWVFLMAIALLTRPLLPVDETRYLAVAWEMWRDGNFLVPHLNGETYSHKPPMLFWLFHGGWAIFGVNEWWPRLVAPLFGLGCLFLSVQLARQLWPDRQDIAQITPVILFGCAFWVLFTTLTMFDMIVAFWTLLGLLGIVMAWRAHSTGQSARRGFFWLAMGIGFGLLAKGPAILLHTLPVAILAPWWGPHLDPEAPSPHQPKWWLWYLGVIAATLAGAAIVLAWALPAAWAGGKEYADAIFWGQSAGRMVDSFAHNRPWWWYLAVLPPLTLPWFVWPRLWHATRTLGTSSLQNGGVRFCLCWFLPAFVAFSLISGKQLHYLLPDFPALALLFAFVLTNTAETINSSQRSLKRSLWLPAIVFIVIGAVAMLGTTNLMPAKFLNRYPNLATEWAGLVIAAGVAAMWLSSKDLHRSVTVLAGLSVVLTVAAHFLLAPMFARNYDIKTLAIKLGDWERQGVHLAHMNKYHGEFNFLGRLKTTMTIVGNQDPDMEIWLQAFPNGKAVSYHYKKPDINQDDAKPVYMQPYKGKFIAIWDAPTMRDHPEIARRN